MSIYFLLSRHYSNSEIARLQDNLRTWLSAPDPSVNQNAASKKCQKDTGRWLLANPAYLDWRDRPDSFLWLQGFAGCGKTILCSTVINDMNIYRASRTQDALAFYYFDFTNDVKTKTLSCLRSIILQLAEQSADTKSLQALHRAYAMGTPPIPEFLDVLKGILCKHDRVYIVMDALDECTDQEEMFDLLNSIRDWKLGCLSILVTSRDEPDIRECVQPAPEQEIHLRNAAIDQDVRLFIRETLQKDKKLKDWSDIFPEIEESLTNGAHGMFRWVDCQFQTLRGCLSRAEVRKALRNLPETLDETCESILGMIRPYHRDYALRLLQWLCIADVPVLLDHVMEAFAASIGDEPHFDPDARFVSSDKVFALCPGLIIRNEYSLWGDTVQIAHYSVKEYLISNRLPVAPNPLCKFRVQLPFASLAMAKTCLVYAIFAPHKPHDLSLGFRRESKASFKRSAKEEWPRFFRNAKRDSQLMKLAISYLTRKNGHTLDGDINAAMSFAIEHRFSDIETWLVDHHRPSIDPSLVLLAKCDVPEIHSLGFVDFWIKQGADVNARSAKLHCRPLSSTPLHMAAYGCNVALAQLLLQQGASLKVQDSEGNIPLEVAFKNPAGLTLDLIELLWVNEGHNRFDSRGRNLLHQFASIRYQKRDKVDSLGNNAVLMEETVAWLINHGVDPLGKDAKGETPLHKAARRNNFIAIEALYAATGRSSEYGGCLLSFLLNIRREECMLSTAQLLFEIDPYAFGEFKDVSGLFSFLLQDAATHVKSAAPADSVDSALNFGFTARILNHEKNPAHTKLDLYMSFLEAMLQDCPNSVSTILRWLAMELVKRRDPEFLGIELWSAALTILSRCLVDEVGYRNRERVSNNLFRMIQELFERRKSLGVDTKELCRLLLCTALGQGPLAKLIISQEPAYTALALPDKISNVPWSKGLGRRGDSFVSLMVHREIHPDTRNKDDNATILNAIKQDPPEIVRLLTKKLLLTRAYDINHQSPEGLTILAANVAYLPFASEWDEVLKSCLDAGCDANIQDDAGRTPLMIAARRGRYEFAEILLRAGCNANLQDWEGGTPVTDIVVDSSVFWEFSHSELWKERFSPVGGHTALMYAVIVGSSGIVKALLKYGCDTKLKNNQGRTALDLARHFDESYIVEILEGHEASAQSEYEESNSSDYEEYEQSDDENHEQNSP